MGFNKLENWPPPRDERGGIAGKQGSDVPMSVSEADPEPGRTNADRYITSQIAVHDRTQLEAVFDYSLLEQSPGKRAKLLRYEVEAFLFFPRQMGIKPHNYPKERFYNDLRPLIRLREPEMSYKQLLGVGAGSSRSPINVVRSFVAEAAKGSKLGDEKLIVDEARLFACSFVSYLLRRVERRAKKIRKVYREKISANTADSAVTDEFIDTLTNASEILSKSYNLMREWRRIVADCRKLPEDRAKLLRNEVMFVDEYMAYRFRDGVARMIRILNSVDPLAAGAEFQAFRRKLRAYSRLEHWYSDRAGFVWVDRGSLPTEIEHYVYRRGALKRRVWRVLYLAVRTRPMFAFQQQLGAMIAAGLAAFWAVAAEIVIRSRAMSSGGNLFQHLSGGTFVLITAFILAYILKDRIKEVGRSYFRSGPFVKIPDNSERIYFETASGHKWQIGSISEYTKFLTPDRIPEEIRKLRQLADPDGLEADDGPEDVIKYRKVIRLRPEILGRYFYPINAVHDILRLNVHAFLSKLDDPEQSTEILDPSGKVIEMKMPKVYHMDVVLKYSRLGKSSDASAAIHDHIRLVINKKGLYRIERLS